jgi:apolipoprotein N-acyltransferase
MAALDATRTLGGAAAAGAVMGAAFTVGVFSWFAGAMAHYAGAPGWVGVAVLLALTPVVQPQFVGFAIARRLAGRMDAGFWTTTVVGACAYVGTEWLCPKLFADTLGHGVYASPLLRQAADLGGAPGLTFLLVVANSCALRIARRQRGAWRAAGAIAAIVAGLATYGAVRLRQLDALGDGKSITAGVVQADVSGYESLRERLGTYDAVRGILDAHFALSEQAIARGPLDLLIWPETVYPTTFGAPKSLEGAAFDREIDAFVARTRVPLVFGAYDAGDGAEFNAAMFLAPAVDGRLGLDAYRKATLFPLTERVPALLDTPAIRRRLPWLGTWTPGPGATVVDLPLADGRTLRIAPLICYDAVDPTLVATAVRHGADLIVTLSNDSWFARGGGPRLHFVVSAFRTLETRRPQLRATNTGISAVITPSGEIVAVAGVHERTALVARVTPVAGVTTLVLQWGDWVGPASLAAALVLLGVVAARRPHSAPRNRATRSSRT